MLGLSPRSPFALKARVSDGPDITPQELLAAIAYSWGSDLGIPRPQRYEDFARKYGTVVWVYLAVSINAQNTASVPLKVFRRLGKAADDLEEASDSPMAQLLTRVNPLMTRFDLWECTSSNLDLVGNEYWLLYPDKQGVPVELWPLHPARVTLIPDRQQGIWGYEYELWNERFRFARRWVIHLKAYNPWHDFYGQGALGPAWADAETAESSIRYRRAFYANSGRVDGVLSSDQPAPADPMIQKLRENWQQLHVGPDKAHKIAILWQGLKYQIIAVSPKDADVVNDAKMSRDNLLAAFRVPLAAAGIEVGDIGRREEQIRNYREGTIKPRCIKIEETINEFLAPLFGPEYSAHFDFTGYIKEDEERRARIDEQEIRAGIRLINEVRKARGLDPLPWGDKWFVPISLVPAGEPLFEPEPIALPPSNGKPALPAGEPKALAVRSVADAVKLGVLRAIGNGDAPEAEWPVETAVDELLTREAMWDAFVEKATPLERRFSVDVRRALDAVGREVARRVRAGEGREAIRGTDDLPPLLERVAERRLPGALEAGWRHAERTLRRRRAAAVPAGVAAETKAEVGVDFSLQIPGLRGYLEARPKKYAEDVTKTTIEAFRHELEEGTAAGESIDQMADRILEVTDLWESRARTIARTEVIGASNLGATVAYEESGVVEAKEWLTARDERVRDAHAEADGQVVPLNEPFRVGGEDLDYPGDFAGSPENVIGCRCAVLPVLEGG